MKKNEINPFVDMMLNVADGILAIGSAVAPSGVKGLSYWYINNKNDKYFYDNNGGYFEIINKGLRYTSANGESIKFINLNLLVTWIFKFKSKFKFVNLKTFHITDKRYDPNLNLQGKFIKRNKMKKRDYDKEPLIIKNYSVYFALSYYLLLCFICFIVIGYCIITKHNVVRLEIEILAELVGVYVLIYLILSTIKNHKYQRENPSYFEFTNKDINSFLNFQFFDSIIKKTNLISKNFKGIPNPALNLEKVYFCVICELGENYGRFHYFTPYELYKKSSIGVHIGKIVLYIRHLALYLLFALPYKIYKLKKTNEPLWLLKKNFVIRCKNRNYLLVNVYSVKEHNELLEYFKSINIEVENKTKFIPHIQNDGWFQDKNEIWSDDFSDTEIPKDIFKKKVRRFFSLD